MLPYLKIIFRPSIFEKNFLLHLIKTATSKGSVSANVTPKNTGRVLAFHKTLEPSLFFSVIIKKEYSVD